MSTYNPFKVNSSNNNTNPFSSVQNKFSSNISNNNPFLPQNNQSFSNISNPFTKMNSVNNNKFPSQNTTNPFLSSSNNNNNNFLNNNNSTFNSINNNTNFLSNNNNTNTSNPFLSTNTTVNNPFLKSSNQNNISNNPFSTNSNSGFLNNNQNFSSSNSNPFTSTLNSNNNNNYNPFLSNRGNNNNNIFNSYSGNSSINFSQNNNNIFNSTNNFGNSGSTISFGFNNNNSNNNFIFNNNSQNINNNNFFINSQQYTPMFNSEQNNKSFSQGNNNIVNEKNNKNPSKKSIPLSKILSLRFQSEDFLEEFLTTLNEDTENAKILSKSLNLNNYNDFIIETILSSKSKKDEYINKEEDSTHNILKERNMEIKRRRERILNEERYQRYLKNLYRKSEKDDLKRLIQLNSQKQSINNFVYNSEQKRKKINLDEIKNNDSDKNKNERDFRKINNNNKSIVYKIFIKVINDKKENILEKNIVVDKKQNYILDLDKLYIDITSSLKILDVNCRYGLNYKINDFEIEKNIRKINLLEYDAQGSIKTENDYYKELRMEISIINEENISEEEALLNPQLHCKNDKNYKLNPSLDIINNSNLFQYNKGLEIIFENISIIFSNKELYDFTSINFDELCYDGNYDIFFDESKYKKEKSTFKKLWDRNICLIFKQLDSENKIFTEFLEKRYAAEFFEEKEGKIVIITKLKNLFLIDKERKGFLLNNKSK